MTNPRSFCMSCRELIDGTPRARKVIWTYDVLFDTVSWNDEPFSQLVECDQCGEAALRLIAIRNAHFAKAQIAPQDADLWKSFQRAHHQWAFFGRTTLDKDQERILTKRRQELSVLCVTDGSRINSRQADLDANMDFDTFRDAVYWSDEGYNEVCDTCRDLIGSLLVARQRYLDGKRPLPALLRVWESFQTRHPNWPGFKRLHSSDDVKKTTAKLRTTELTRKMIP